jgi:hypothetical protein
MSHYSDALIEPRHALRTKKYRGGVDYETCAHDCENNDDCVGINFRSNEDGRGKCMLITRPDIEDGNKKLSVVRDRHVAAGWHFFSRGEEFFKHAEPCEEWCYTHPAKWLDSTLGDVKGPKCSFKKCQGCEVPNAYVNDGGGQFRDPYTDMRECREFDCEWGKGCRAPGDSVPPSSKVLNEFSLQTKAHDVDPKLNPHLHPSTMRHRRRADARAPAGGA